jgi:hypothetical protein
MQNSAYLDIKNTLATLEGKNGVCMFELRIADVRCVLRMEETIAVAGVESALRSTLLLSSESLRFFFSTPPALVSSCHSRISPYINIYSAKFWNILLVYNGLHR